MVKCKELVSICLICMLANNIDSRENKLFSVRCCVAVFTNYRHSKDDNFK